MSAPIRRRSSSPASVALAIALFAVCAVLGLAGLNREAAGEPVIPQQVSHFFNRSDPGLPDGLNYDLSVLEPDTQKPLTLLPQLGTVEVRLAITNDSALPMKLDFPTSLQCEFIVRRIYSFLGGLFVVPLEVWRSSYFHNFSRQPSRLVLKPGETKVYTAYWTVSGLNQLQVPPGDYRVYTSIQGIRPIFIPKPL